MCRFPLFLIMFLAFAVYAQQKQRVAVLPSVGELEPKRLELLTDKVREIATKTLPPNSFMLLRQEAVISAIGGEEEFFTACKEGTCIGELVKKANANYGARCDVLKLDGDLVLRFELYSVDNEAILETFTDYNAKDFYKMLAVLDERLPVAFRKMLPASRGLAPLPSVVGGIGAVETIGDAAFEFERSFVLSLSTEPEGALPSFNGVPVGSCSKTPCKVELPEGSVRIVAALEQYETADTTISVRQNNQNVNIKLKPNFGILDIKPAYSENIGNNKKWNLTINNRAFSSFENRFSPGNYEVKLSHECYEDISFEVGITKGGREIFDMDRHIQLKMGGLDLRAEKDGEPVAEPVFVNGNWMGETPFSRSVPVCAEVAVGKNKDKVEAKIKHKETVRHVHKIMDSNILVDPRDGKKYRTVRIGDQVWMAENLNYEVRKFFGLFKSSGSKCYDNKQENCNMYGRLYDWNTARSACPSGWHLPSDDEWTDLIYHVSGVSMAGKKLKTRSGWEDSSNGTDEFGFAALPGGYGYSAGSFSNVGSYGSWWSATEGYASNAWSWIMYGSNDYVNNHINLKTFLFSIRCVKD